MKMLLSWALLSGLTVPAFAADSARIFGRGDALPRGEPAAELPTVFNGIEVPPMKELTPDTFDSTLKDGYWLVARIPCCG